MDSLEIKGLEDLCLGDELTKVKYQYTVKSKNL